jgi:hypothetical protein
MSKIKIAMAIVVIFVLVSCSINAPTFAPTLKPLTTSLPKAKATSVPTPTATPVPDVPIYRNSFEDIPDLSASGITSNNARIKITTENVDYASGNQALEIYGTLPGAQWSFIQAEFNMKKFIGEDTLDLSDKTIGYSDFIPDDSPIQGGITISVMKGNKTVSLGSGVVVPGDSQRKGVWQDNELDVEEVYKNRSWTYTDLNDEEARDVIKHCEIIIISGSRNTEGASAEANFYLDNLNWIRNDRFNLPVDDSIDSLRKYAANQHFKFGLFSADFTIFGPENNPWHWPGDPWYAYEVAKEGAVNASIVFPIPEPGEDYSNFNLDPVKEARAIQIYDFGNSYSMTVLGYGMGSMSGSAPEWIRNLGYPDATKALLLYHVEKQLRLTQGQKPVWILFNEFTLRIQYGGKGLRSRQEPMLGIDGYDYGDEGHYSPWAGNKTDSSLIEAAIIKAHEVDPGATLLLNDWNDDEQIGLKTADYLYQFASGLKDKGIPIDGVGFQMHNSIEPGGTLTYMIPFTWPWQWEHINLDTWLQNVDLNVKRYASQGLKVAFTEVEGQIKISDIDLNTPEGRAEYDKRLQWQAKYYAGLLKIAMNNENVIMFHIWGVTDRYQNISDVEGYGNGFIFDKNFNPKPAYYAMLKLLKGQ